MTIRNFTFAVGTLVVMLLCWTTLRTLVTFSRHSDVFPYTGVIPLLSAALIYWERARIFSKVRNSFGLASLFLALGLVVRWCGARNTTILRAGDSLSVLTFALVVLWIGVFVLSYGGECLQAAAFPLLFLFLMTPLPHIVLDRTIPFLQGSSSQMAGVFFRLGGVPVFQDGFRFSLPGLDVEVARQCSGIRSGLALLITSILMGHIFLDSFWRKLWLVLAAFPITVVKNGLRIVTIYWLSVHSSLGPVTTLAHRYGGVFFSLAGLLFLALFVFLLGGFDGTVSERPLLVCEVAEFRGQRRV